VPLEVAEGGIGALPVVVEREIVEARVSQEVLQHRPRVEESMAPAVERPVRLVGLGDRFRGRGRRVEVGAPDPFETRCREPDAATGSERAGRLDEEQDRPVQGQVLEEMLAVHVVEPLPRPGFGHVGDLIDPGESPDIDVPPLRHEVVRPATDVDAVEAARDPEFAPG